MFLFGAGPIAEPDVYLCLKLFPFLVEIMTLFTDVTWRLTRLGLDPEARSLSRNKDPYLIAETQKNCQIKQISCNNSCKPTIGEMFSLWCTFAFSNQSHCFHNLKGLYATSSFYTGVARLIFPLSAKPEVSYWVDVSVADLWHAKPSMRLTEVEVCQSGMKMFLHGLSVLWDQLTQAHLISMPFASSCRGNLEVTIHKLGKWRTILTPVSECTTQGHRFSNIFVQAPQQRQHSTELRYS